MLHSLPVGQPLPPPGSLLRRLNVRWFARLLPDRHHYAGAIQGVALLVIDQVHLYQLLRRAAREALICSTFRGDARAGAPYNTMSFRIDAIFSPRHLI
jgi:hypothetical protein